MQEIRALGYEVYLAVDEFSWSKRTLARLLRRRIVNMSVADQWDTYVFPNAIPINIAMPEDIARLRSCFPGRSVTLVAGCDVVCGASAYRSLRPGGVQELDHLLIRRGETDETDIRTRLQAHFSLDPDSRLTSIRLINETMKSENKPILITGDFNMEPDSKEFKAMKQTWRLLSDPTLETYPSDHPRLRLDYIFGDLKHEFRIINDQVIDIQSSDHLPIYIDVLF